MICDSEVLFYRKQSNANRNQSNANRNQSNANQNQSNANRIQSNANRIQSNANRNQSSNQSRKNLENLIDSITGFWLIQSIDPIEWLNSIDLISINSIANRHSIAFDWLRLGQTVGETWRIITTFTFSNQHNLKKECEIWILSDFICPFIKLAQGWCDVGGEGGFGALIKHCRCFTLEHNNNNICSTPTKK